MRSLVDRLKIAALDLGSNSFHLIVAEARLDGSFVTLVADKAMLRLGDIVARTGAIGREASDDAVDVLQRFRAISDSSRVDEIVAVGTAALREARDSVAFVDRVRDEVGIDINVVDGVEEARLIFTAVRASVLIDRPPALAADLGGGSLELMVGDQSTLLYASSVKAGVARLSATLCLSDPPSSSDHERLSQHLTHVLGPTLHEVRAHQPKMLIGSSGTLTSLAAMALASTGEEMPDSLNQLTVSRDDLDVVFERVFALPAAQRAKLPGADAKRAELLPAGAAVLAHLMDATGIREFTLSEWALREGIVLESIGAHDRADLQDDPRAIRRASVLSLCRRSNWRQPHARQVASLATMLFDKTPNLHHLGDVDRELLELGALLHDIGEHISRTDHDRHAAYLVENGGLRGFAPNEIRLLSALTRFHVRGTPRSSTSDAFGALEVHDRARVTALVAILRLADALDATHSGVVLAIDAEEKEDLLRLRLHARGDAELEQWTFRRKKDLFERTFHVELELDEIPQGSSDYDAAITSGLG
jgi:exopolyphosphatase/guanosine-5'-triphosphate,3'-diphosphate pyrophosphatase